MLAIKLHPFLHSCQRGAILLPLSHLSSNSSLQYFSIFIPLWQCQLWQRNPFHKTFGTEYELILPSKNNNHNRKFDRLDLSLLFYSKEKMPALGHMNNFFFSFVLDFWMMKRGRPSKFIFYFVQYIHTYDRMPDFKNRWYMAVRKK